MRYKLKNHRKEQLKASEEDNKGSTDAAMMFNSDIGEAILIWCGALRSNCRLF
jgi:hypothetical protein